MSFNVLHGSPPPYLLEICIASAHTLRPSQQLTPNIFVIPFLLLELSWFINFFFVIYKFIDCIIVLLFSSFLFWCTGWKFPIKMLPESSVDHRFNGIFIFFYKTIRLKIQKSSITYHIVKQTLLTDKIMVWNIKIPLYSWFTKLSVKFHQSLSLYDLLIQSRN